MIPVIPLLDDVNRQLLDALQQDARVPYSELGRRVGLSAPATAERIRRMEEAGLILGYRAQLSPAALGYPLQAVVRLTVERGQDSGLIRHVLANPWTERAEHVTGSDCYVLHLHVSGVAHLEQEIMALKAYGNPITSVVLSSLKETGFSLPPVQP